MCILKNILSNIWITIASFLSDHFTLIMSLVSFLAGLTSIVAFFSKILGGDKKTSMV